eukprot:3570628-Prymnesium_polylepis.1
MAKWVDSYPALLPFPTRGQFTLRPVRGTQWRRTATGEFFVADDDNAIPCTNWSGLDLAPTGGHKMPT